MWPGRDHAAHVITFKDFEPFSFPIHSVGTQQSGSSAEVSDTSTVVQQVTECGDGTKHRKENVVRM